MIKNVKELWPELEETDYGRLSGAPFYREIIGSFGYEELIEVSDDAYQGDSRYLLKNGNKIGWLRFGWGSCGGCDALQGCETIQDLQELYDHLYNSIRWFDTKEEALDFFKNHDWRGDYSGYSWDKEEECEEKRFVRLCIELLSPTDKGTK